MNGGIPPKDKNNIEAIQMTCLFFKKENCEVQLIKLPVKIFLVKNKIKKKKKVIKK